MSETVLYERTYVVYAPDTHGLKRHTFMTPEEAIAFVAKLLPTAYPNQEFALRPEEHRLS